MADCKRVNSGGHGRIFGFPVISVVKAWQLLKVRRSVTSFSVLHHQPLHFQTKFTKKYPQL